ncbi:5-formyltetrahydrofolate cyclo-ligase [Lichenihabitans sp. Uapishka_5]|uniref:5-formyltetrahydrofolate cyclo-ligase n=1 Tax=Lichenihabitans sp. Uapishka_5 TaxID=3037302 RepID=UPI0029E7EAFA|nr:5-formyltetrahydrofolate cyclo-ligase [Lichenihabitans sp. Uapishka_5]MDX7951397.1 5-formyltetrahydrofolate cyclo-ligase [Lichenihabitans sp. Uapishka_5]
MAPSPKVEIRAAALSRRAAVPPAEREAFAARLATVGPGLVRSAVDPTADPVVAAFLPIRDEPDTGALLAVLHRIGLVTVLPVAGAPGTPLTFRRWAPGDPLEVGTWGLRHPPATADTVVPDVLFVPVAAFDRRGARIGYGGGYYDATLAALRQTRRVQAIGVAFVCQEELYLPCEDHDEPLDLVVTERGIILCEA